jgi:hypothetical protein
MECYLRVCRLWSSGLRHFVSHVVTKVSDEHIVSVIRVDVDSRFLRNLNSRIWDSIVP